MNKDIVDMPLGADEKSSSRPRVQGFFDPRTYSVQYVVSDPATDLCAIIDPVLDYDEKSGSTATTLADAILEYVRSNGLTVAWILDTHPHADHFSAATYLKEITGAPTGIGEHVVDAVRNADAALHRVRDPPHRPQLHAQGFGLVVAIVVIHRHVRAGGRQLARNGATDTTRSARDKRDFSGERA